MIKLKENSNNFCSGKNPHSGAVPLCEAAVCYFLFELRNESDSENSLQFVLKQITKKILYIFSKQLAQAKSVAVGYRDELKHFFCVVAVRCEKCSRSVEKFILRVIQVEK